MLSEYKTPLLKVLFILHEAENSGTIRLTAEQISDYALHKYKELLTARTVTNCINRASEGMIKKYTSSEHKVEYQILNPGIELIQSKRGKQSTELSVLSERGLHPRIIEVSGRLFADGHYSSAILEAFKEVNNRVKAKSGLADKDGSDLMVQAFRLESPKLKLSNLKSQSDLDEQKGFMFIFMGAMIGIRNPKAHERVIQLDSVKTLEYLTFASLLVRRVDEAQVVTN